MGVHTPIGPKHFKPDQRARRQRQLGLPHGWKAVSFAAGRRARYKRQARSLLPYIQLSFVAFFVILAGLIGYDQFARGAALTGPNAAATAWMVPKAQEMPEDVDPQSMLESDSHPYPDAINQRVSARFSRCSSGGGINCVVDGDTFWYQGAKIRVADIDTPETHPPRCALEAQLGSAATRRLQSLLNVGPFRLESIGRDTDRYGRKLMRVMRDGNSIGDTLVAEGLARPYAGGHRNGWCSKA